MIKTRIVPLRPVVFNNIYGRFSDFRSLGGVLPKPCQAVRQPLLNSSKGCGYLASFGCLSKTVRRKVGRPFERRDVTAPEHENFFAVFATRHGWQFKKEGTTVTFFSS